MQLRQEANGDEPNYEAEGLMSRLDGFLAANREETDGDQPASGVDINLGGDPPPSDPPPGDGESPPAKPDEAPPADEIEDEDDLPSIGDKKDQGQFDEDAFDKQTDKEVEGLDPKQAAAWRKIKAREKEARKRALELEEQVKSASVPKELEVELARLRTLEKEAEALRQRNEELLRANDQTAVRSTDEFKQSVEAPLSEMKEIVAKMAEVSNIDPRILAQVIEEPNIAEQDKMLDALADKLPQRTISRLERLSDDYKAILAKERSLLENAGKTLEESRIAREQEVIKERQRHVESFRSAVGDSFTNYARRIPGFTDSSGALTDIAEAAIAKTQTIDPNSLSSEDLGYMAFATNALPELRRAYVEMSKELALAKAGKRTGGNIGGAPPSSAPSGESDVDDDGEPEGLMARFRKQRFESAV